MGRGFCGEQNDRRRVFAAVFASVEGARDRAAAGELCFGTVDSFLIWRLSGGRRHVTDATNASRTSLYNIHENDWDDELLALFDVPRAGLPQVLDCADEFGVCDDGLFGADLPIRGVAGDQQAAAIGQGCFTPGALKSTSSGAKSPLCPPAGRTARTRSASTSVVRKVVSMRTASEPTGRVVVITVGSSTIR